MVRQGSRDALMRNARLGPTLIAQNARCAAHATGAQEFARDDYTKRNCNCRSMDAPKAGERNLVGALLASVATEAGQMERKMCVGRARAGAA